MVRALFLVGCVIAFLGTAAAGEPPRLDGIDLRLRLAPVAAAPFAFSATTVASDNVARIDDMTRHAENTITSFLESAQHLGSPYRGWLWVTPYVGHEIGATLRFDFR
jgi:hypothetical protein